MNELDIAKKIKSGALSSPQKYENIWLFDLRITGTGFAFRDKHDEIAYREPDKYLNDEFLERCQGLPVIFVHPEKQLLDTDEFRERVIGSIMLPYIKGQEIWGIARIYDADAAILMQTTHTSTSPGVLARGVSAELESGESLLIEAEPAYLDHLAICQLGTWDLGREPSGVSQGVNQ